MAEMVGWAEGCGDCSVIRFVKVQSTILSLSQGEEVQIKASGKNLLASCSLMVVNFTPKRYIKVSEALYNLCCFPSSFLTKDQRTPLLEAVKNLTKLSEPGISRRISPASWLLHCLFSNAVSNDVGTLDWWGTSWVTDYSLRYLR